MQVIAHSCWETKLVKCGAPIWRDSYLMLFDFSKTGIYSIYYHDYPLVNVYIANWKITMLSMGKSTISMAIFNSYFDITRGYHD